MVGTSFPYIEFFPKPGQARGVQSSWIPCASASATPSRSVSWATAAARWRRSCPCSRASATAAFLERAQKGMKDWTALMLERGTRPDTPMKPQVVAHELGARLRDDAIVASDSGTITTWCARHIPARRGQMYSLSGNLATMANGLPYAIAAQERSSPRP